MICVPFYEFSERLGRNAAEIAARDPLFYAAVSDGPLINCLPFLAAAHSGTSLLGNSRDRILQLIKSMRQMQTQGAMQGSADWSFRIFHITEAESVVVLAIW